MALLINSMINEARGKKSVIKAAGDLKLPLKVVIYFFLNDLHIPKLVNQNIGQSYCLRLGSALII